MPKRRHRSPRFRPLRQPLGILELECPHGCVEYRKGTPADGDSVLPRGPLPPLNWQTKLLAFDGNGPIYVDAHCPECGRAGRRATIRESDLDDNLVNDEEIADIGQERIYTFLFLITQIFDPADPRPEKQLYPVLTAEFIALNSCQRSVDVERHMKELHEKKWFDVATVGEKKYKVALGKPWAAWGKNAKTDTVAK